jgi:hypothetical protein
MIRTIAIALGLALVAASANAADITVQTAGKTPAQIRADISDAANKACARAYADDNLSVYKRSSCVYETYQAAMAQVPSTQTAMNTRTDRAN